MKYEINIPACSSTDLQEIKRDIERVIYNHTGCATILKKANVSGSLPPMVEIEFGNHLYAKIDLQDGVKVLNVVNGWGDKVDLDLVKVKAAMTG
jgi:hypothetical protein